MNFARDFVDAAAADPRALLELARDGSRREWTFGEVADASARLAGRLTRVHGVQKGDLVVMVIGNRPEWVLAMVACFRIGAIALPCNEQLRAKDLRYRLYVAKPKLILADDRNAPRSGRRARLPGRVHPVHVRRRPRQRPSCNRPTRA